MSRTPSLLFLFLTIFLLGLVTARRCEIKCNRPNEEYQCGSACQTRCDNLGVPCPIINIRCNDACYCIDGFARNGSDSARCIPISMCPEKCY